MWKERYKEKLVRASQVARVVRHGDLVVCTGGMGKPYEFLDALSTREGKGGIRVITSLSLFPSSLETQLYRWKVTDSRPKFGIEVLIAEPGESDLPVLSSGAADLLPTTLSSFSKTVEDLGGADVLVFCATPPDEDGNLYISGSLDCVPELLSEAEVSGTIIVAEVNRNLPRVAGETALRVEDVDYIIESNRPVPTLEAYSHQMEEKAARIGSYLAELVPDEATLHVSPHLLAQESAKYLNVKRHLGVHSDCIGEVFLYLYSCGAVTCARKSLQPGKWVGTYIMGSKELIQFANGSRDIVLYSGGFVANVRNIAANRRMVSISAASYVDLTGQVYVDFTTEGMWGAWSIRDFHVGATSADEGIGIVILSSIGTPGTSSSIVLPGESKLRRCTVAVRADEVDTIVTEYGVARLKGKSLRERALSLISIAHPVHQDELLKQARQINII